jgi:hypothetical protein
MLKTIYVFSNVLIDWIKFLLLNDKELNWEEASFKNNFVLYL